ncbi:MAG: YeeE/YedE thiosulfate transporter family protein [Bdellovibrionota bacterium]
MQQDWINALFGGGIIGISVSLMLLLNGRVTGISGIVNGILSPLKGDTAWRVLFVAGLFFGGLILKVLRPTTFDGVLATDTWTLISAGLLVGFGTVMGSGCTSGHGVCGISRLSLRSLAATIIFIVAGIAAVCFFKKIGILI